MPLVHFSFFFNLALILGHTRKTRQPTNNYWDKVNGFELLYYSIFLH